METNSEQGILEKVYRIELIEDLLGTVAKDKKLYETYMESKKPETVTDKESASVEDIEEKGWTGFHKDENGLFLYDYLIKGFIKHAGNVLKDIVKVKNLRSKITDYVFVAPRKIHLGQFDPDGVFERPLRAQTPQGERVCLARSDYVKAGVQFDFKVIIIPHKEISIATIDKLMEYGQFMGLGQFRNGSFGRFKVIA